jgi:hypothetical protein
MKNYTFQTNVASVEHNNDKVIYPFSPPLFQTNVGEELIEKLLAEGAKLTKNEDDANLLLAGNLLHGRSLSYKEETVKELEPVILKKIKDFLTTLDLQFNSTWTAEIFDKLYLDNLWVNFSKKYDFNPPHTHNSEFSFVIYCSVPQNIFDIQADSNTKEAGNIVFQYGEKICNYMFDRFSVSPYDGLMFIFPAKLKHFVPPYWVDETRVSVSGSVMVKP